MKSIRNKKYWLASYSALAICILTIPAILVSTFKHDLSDKTMILLITMSVLFSTYIFLIFKRLLVSYQIDISNNGILLTKNSEKKKIKWSEISDIEYFENTDFSGSPSIKIKLNNSKKLIFLNHYHYSNSDALTQTIKYCYESFNNEDFNLDLFIPIEINSIPNKHTRFEKFDFINRTPLTTMRSYLPIVGVWGVYKVLTTESIPQVGIIVILIMFLLSLFIGIVGIGKIGISDNYLTIENFYLPIQKTYRLSDINKIFIENPGGNSPNLIRIITNDYNQKSFRLANFIKNDWLQTEKILKGKGISVDNRLY